jgi:N-formylglutamate amidohydrolase
LVCKDKIFGEGDRPDYYLNIFRILAKLFCVFFLKFCLMKSQSSFAKIFIKFFLLFYVSVSTAFSQSFIPGQSYLDSNQYVEYIAGNLPFVISVPHGGYLEPASIPDRNCSGCKYMRDSYTQELGREIMAAFYAKTGCWPHMVINLLHRKKFDANRDIGDAADGNPIVEKSWYAYHAFLDSAKSKIESGYGRGLFIDLHGHGHSIQRLEVGYLLSSTKLRYTDSVLNTQAILNITSIKNLAGNNLNGLNHAQLVRGPYALGSILSDMGFPAVPSQAIPYPASGDPYFSGGYNTKRHGSRYGGNIDGIQIEGNHNVRFDSITRKRFADSLANALIYFYNKHYNSNFTGNYCGLLYVPDKNAETMNIEIFPNPATTVLYVKADVGGLDIEVYNSAGQLVMKQKLDSGTFDISGLEKGVYFVRLNSAAGVLYQRIILKL